MKPFLAALCALGLIGGLVGGVYALKVGDRAENLAETRVFGTAEQNAQTQVYYHSQAYLEGTRRDLDNLYLSYVQEKDLQTKQAILSVIRQRVQAIPPDVAPTVVPSQVRTVLQ